MLDRLKAPTLAHVVSLLLATINMAEERLPAGRVSNLRRAVMQPDAGMHRHR